MKTRFCPSPTGLMHVGNLRTAFFNWLAAGTQGTFLIRIEDTDQDRSYAAHTETLLADLRALNLDWTEGPYCEGHAGPYWQSQRRQIYDAYYTTLLATGHAYPCYCSDETLALNRKIQLASRQPPRYPGTCRHLSDAKKAEHDASGQQASLRYAVSDEIDIVFNDLVKGKQIFKGADFGDFIIRRADGSAPFMFANAIDDALMGVSLALRGEDHLTNTPRQLLLLRTLGLPEPQYGHISLILGKDGAPLSKRSGSKSVHELRGQGYLSCAILNYLARLGHYYPQEGLLSLAELRAQFDVTQLSRSPAHFDEVQLNYWQKQAMLQAEDRCLLACVADQAIWKEFTQIQQSDFLKLVRENCLFPSDARLWLSCLMEDETVLTPLCLDRIRSASMREFFEIAQQALQANKGADFVLIRTALTKHLKLKGKALFLPLRLAVTGLEAGPELPLLIGLMGKKRLDKRFQNILDRW